MMAEVTPTVVSVNISEKTGEKKHNIDCCDVVTEHGLADDAHAGEWHRQVSLLATESIDKMRLAGLDVWPGDFAENLTTQGIDLVSLPVGTRLKVGGDVVLEVTQIGKICHERCAIYYQAGDCVMPREGVFARVLEGGKVEVGDGIQVIE
jgi:MOSC domain-containing protein YiiM